MPNYHSVATAARHATRRVSLSRSAGIYRPIVVSSSTLASQQQLSSFDCTIPPRIAGTTRMMGSNSSLIYGSTLNNDTSSTGMKVLAATIAATSSIAIITNNNSLTLCESPTTSNNTEGLADETEEDSSNSIIQDGMDAGSEVPIKSPKFDNLSIAEEDDDDSEDTTANTADNSNGTDTANNNNDNNEEEDDEDDPSKDEQTSCSICLINRQGPCRKQWLKFEKCMKEHGAEQDREKARKEKDTSKVSEGLDGIAGGDSGDSGVDDSIENDGEEKQLVSKEEMEGEWDDFMVKSTKPGEDDEDDDEDEEEEEDDDDDEEESEDEDTDNSNEEDTDTSSAQHEEEDKEDISLSQRCDKFMIPWISCIQEHRNIYSLISNDFYQKDYIDPLEYTVHDSRRLCYNKDHSEIIGEVDGYVIKYHGVEIDLGSWREHVEAESDESNVDDTTTKAAVPTEEPHLINAYAKFQLTNPTNSQPIEVAYIKDQNGRLLGFDSFTKGKEESGGGSSTSNSSDEEGMPHKSDEEKAAAPPVSNDGECTFHIVPGETTSITAYAIYRGDVVKKGDESTEEGEGKVAGMREDFLFTTPAIPLPGVKNQK